MYKRGTFRPRTSSFIFHWQQKQQFLQSLILLTMAAVFFLLSALFAGAFAGDLLNGYGYYGAGYGGPFVGGARKGVALPVVGVAKVAKAVPAAVPVKAAVAAYPAGYGYGNGYPYGYNGYNGGYGAYPAGYGYGAAAYPAGYGYGAAAAYPAGYGYGAAAAYPAGYGYGAAAAYPAGYGYGYGRPYGGYGYGVAAPAKAVVGVKKVVAAPVAGAKVGVKVGGPNPLAYDVFDNNFGLDAGFFGKKKF